MPIKFDLREIKDKYRCNFYLETGLYQVRECSSIINALNSGFEKCYTIEIQKKWINYAKNKSKLKDIINKNIISHNLFLINDDSCNLEKYILNDSFEENKCLFFLDAHADDANIKSEFKCPVDKELEAISKLKRKDHVICIDDMRIIREKSPWNDNRYNDYFDKIKELLMKINKDYNISFLKGIQEKDVLIAYI